MNGEREQGTIPGATFPKLGRPVSKLGYGAWALSGQLGSFDRNAAIRSVLTYLERGGQFIDTARAYGASERLVGQALEQWSGERPVLATKVEGHGRPRRWGMPCPADEVFPRGSVRASAETSLRQLGLDVIDLLQLHVYWPTWGTNGYWLDELYDLRDEGLVRAIGISLPDHRHDIGLPAVLANVVDSVQTIVNIFDPLALDCLVPVAEQHDVAIIARGVLDEGGLTGTVELGATFAPEDVRSVYFTRERAEEYGARLDGLRRFIPEHAPTLAALALKFVASQAGVTTAIVSMPDEWLVRENVKAFQDESLPAEVVDELRTRHRWVRNFFTPLYWD
jgi:methylglyoxal reductase